MNSSFMLMCYVHRHASCYENLNRSYAMSFMLQVLLCFQINVSSCSINDVFATFLVSQTLLSIRENSKSSERYSLFAETVAYNLSRFFQNYVQTKRFIRSCNFIFAFLPIKSQMPFSHHKSLETP